MDVAFRLAEMMGDRTVRRLAIDAGLDIKTVRAIRDNTATRVDLATLGALASVLGCGPGELVGWAGRRGRGRGPARPPKGVGALGV